MKHPRIGVEYEVTGDIESSVLDEGDSIVPVRDNGGNPVVEYYTDGEEPTHTVAWAGDAFVEYVRSGVLEEVR